MNKYERILKLVHRLLASYARLGLTGGNLTTIEGIVDAAVETGKGGG
jgi:hypothetical protein